MTTYGLARVAVVPWEWLIRCLFFYLEEEMEVQNVCTKIGSQWNRLTNFVLLSRCIAADRNFYDIARKKRSIGIVFRQDVW